MDKADKFLTSLGIDIKQTGEELNCDCPFCLKPKFYFNTETSMWKCHRCQRGGNEYTLIRDLYDSLPELGESLPDYLNQKGVTPETAKRWGLKEFPLLQQTLLPSWNYQGQVTNLYRLSKNRFFGLPGMGSGLFAEEDALKKDSIFVAEGPADGMNLSQLIENISPSGRKITRNKDNSLSLQIGVVAVPGCNTWKQSWSQWFDAKDVSLLFDNDHPKQTGDRKFCPGWDGMQSTLKKLTSASSVSVLKWAESGRYNRDLADGYDISDLLQDQKKLPAWKFIVKSLYTSENTNGQVHHQSENCESFDELINEYSTYLHTPDSYKRTFATMLAVVVSTPIKGDPIWMRIIGPPGSGKTTLVESVSYCENHTFSRSILTGFHSGWREDGTKEDSSLIPKINGKTFIIKDGDTLLRAGNRDKILAELRDIYDGASRAEYRNKISRSYENLRITLLLCGTDSLRGLDRSSLGERFLNCEIVTDPRDYGHFVDHAFTIALKRISESFDQTSEVPDDITDEKMSHLRKLTKGLILYLYTMPKWMPEITDSQGKYIKSLGYALSVLRAKSHETYGSAPSRPEMPTRLTSQFVKLAVALSWVYQVKTLDKQVLDALQHVFFSTCHGYKLSIIQVLYDITADETPYCTRTYIARNCRTSRQTVTGYLQELRHFGITRPVDGGTKADQWQLTPRFLETWTTIVRMGKTKRKKGRS